MSAGDVDEKDRELASRIEALPRAVAPRADLWGGIATRIEASRRRARARRMRVAAFAGLAAAALIAAMVPMLRGANTTAEGAPPAVVSAAIVQDPAVPTLLPEEESYRMAIRSLEASAAEAERALPAKTAEAIARDVKLLESAIDATRAALTKAPDDEELREALRDAYEHEIEVLSDVVDLCART